MRQVLLLLGCLLLFAPLYTGAQTTSLQQGPDAAKFTENKGQWIKLVEYAMRFNHGNLFLEKGTLTYSFYDAHAVEDAIGHHHDGTPGNRPSGLTTIPGHAFKVNFVGHNPNVRVGGDHAYGYYENYYLGDNPAHWATGARVYGLVRYKRLYNGIDMEVYGVGQKLKYDFIVAPGADPNQIQMQFDGVTALYIQNDQLHYETSITHIYEQKPIAYQLINGTRVFVPCAFRITTSGLVNFIFPDGYDQSYPLVIDPTLVFSSYTGSTTDNWGYTATYDNSGHMYAGGIIFRGPGYPVTTGAFQSFFAGGNPGPFTQSYACDIGVSKFTPDGSTLLYSTYLGGNGNEAPHSLVVNSQDELIVYGATSSTNYPVTANALQPTMNGGFTQVVTNVVEYTNGSDIIVTKFNPAGTTLMGSTYVGGTGNDGLNTASNLIYNYADHARGEVVVDDDDYIYIASSTQSTDFPTTTGAYRSNLLGFQDACVFKCSPNLDTLIWSTYYGGTDDDAGYSLKVTASEDVFICGGTKSQDLPNTAGGVNPSYLGGITDGYVTHITNNGTTVARSTYMGTNLYDQAYIMYLDVFEDVYVYGQTLGTYPFTAGVYRNVDGRQFIHKFSNNLQTTMFSTAVGAGRNTLDISPTALLVDVCDNIYISGWGGQVNQGSGFGANLGTTNNMPITPDAYQPNTDGSDFYFMVLSKDADSLVYGSYFGGVGVNGEHVDGGTSRFDENGVIYQAVCASCGGTSIFPTTPGAWAPTSGQNIPGGNCNLAVIKFAFELSTVDVNVTAAPATTGCVPLTVQFDPNAVNAKGYYWEFGNGVTSTDPMPVVTYSDTGTFEVMLVGYDSTTCSGIVLIDTSYVTVVVRDDSLSASFTPFVISDCDSFVVDLQNTSINRGGGTTSYFWDFGDNTTATTMHNRHRYQNPGTYTIKLFASSPNSCNPIDSASYTVTFLPRQNIDFNVSDTVGCLPLTVNFTNLSSTSASGQSFVWEFGNGVTSTDTSVTYTYTANGIYNAILTVTDQGACNPVLSDTVQIRTFDDSISAAFNAISLSTCDSLVVDLQDISMNASSWAWDFGDSSGASIQNPDHTYYAADTFEITLIVSNPNTCNITDTAVQQVVLLPKVSTLFTPDNGCAPLSFTPENLSNNATDQVWTLDGTPFSNAFEPPFNFDSVGTYEILLTSYNPNTCNDSASYTATVNVFDLPNAFFATDTNSYPMFTDIPFDNGSTSPADYFWDFDDGNTAIDSDPEHRYRDEGIFEPCLTVTDNNGCENVYCDTLEITFVGIVDVPNAFSPNGDGNNDILYVRGYGVQELEFRVYNRWGELVFESSSLEQGWDGRYKGEEQEMEVYTYTLKALFENGLETNLRKGNVTLIR